MYVRVPSDLQEPLLKELKQLRLRSYLKYFPALLVIFSAAAALIIIIKGHWLAEMFRDAIPTNISNATLITAFVLLVIVGTGIALVWVMRLEYRACACQECLYCPKCDAVDKYDDGTCPLCQSSLTEKALFYFTTSKDEQKVIERWGLRPAKEAPLKSSLTGTQLPESPSQPPA